jgi:CheY-like chemotaxis protein
LSHGPSPLNGSVVTFVAQIGKPSNECLCVLRSRRRGHREKGNSRHLVWLLRVDFLRLRHLPDTACLVADVHIPGMTSVELHRHLVDAGYAIPTILVTAYPDEVVRDHAPKDGLFATSASRRTTTVSSDACVRFCSRHAERRQFMSRCPPAR